jgi:hypothetical protein
MTEYLGELKGLFHTQGYTTTDIKELASVYVDNKGKECLTFILDEVKNRIHVDELKNCQDNNKGIGGGKEILDTLKQFVFNHPDMHLVIDSDNSFIFNYKNTNKDVSLKLLYILTTGESWYNSLGFHEDYYKENAAFLRVFLEKEARLLLEFFTLVPKDTFYFRDEEYVDDMLSKLANEINNGTYDTLSIREFFIQLKKKQNEELTDLDIFILTKIINVFDKDLYKLGLVFDKEFMINRYDIYCFLQVLQSKKHSLYFYPSGYEGGKLKKQKSNKSRKPKKSRKTKKS